jgi:16S rRNA (guanine527-N7)-methyltransferase
VRNPAAEWWCAAADDPLAPLTPILASAQQHGFLGPGPVTAHLEHTRAFAELVTAPDGPFLDLGSGAGIPGLALAVLWPSTTGTLLDRRARAASFLTDAITTLDLADRVTILHAEAEHAARDARHRGRYTLVTARSFGPPAATAECAAGFLTKGGRLAVSEPPDASTATRWPEEGVARLGFTPPKLHRSKGTTVAILTATTTPNDRWPRPPGTPKKRPLWSPRST